MMRFASACVMFALLAVSTVQAATVSLYIDPSFGSSENTGSTAQLDLTFSEDGSDDVLTVLMQNTTDALLGSKLTAVGFELPASLSLSPVFAVGGTSSYFDELDYNVLISPGSLSAPGGFDVMITSDNNFEGGNANGSPEAGQSQSVILSLGDTGMTPDDLASAFMSYYSGLSDPFVIGRFQSVGPNGEDSDKVGGGIPEPASLCLLGIGGLALIRRR